MALPTDQKALPLILNDNQKQILRTVRERNEPGKQSHVAQEARLPWSTAKAAIDSLIKHGLLHVSEKKELLLTPGRALFCGVSVGKKTTVFVVLDFALRIVSKDRLPLLSADASPEAFGFRPAEGHETEAVWERETPTDSLTGIGDMLMDLCGITLALNSRIPVFSFGMCFGDQVDNRKGLIRYSSILKSGPVSNVDISRLLDRAMIDRFRDEKIRILFEQNAKAALVAERTLGCLRSEPAQNGMLVYMGSGTGAAFLLNGKILREAGSRFGHVRVLYDGKAEELGPCPGCGSYGCLETAIRPLFRTGEENDPDYKSKSGAALAEWLEKKENEEQRMLFAEYLSRSILREVDVLSLEFVVFSGKLSVLFSSVERLFRAKASEQQLKDTLIFRTSALGDHAAAVGAALCGYFDWLGEPID